MGRWVGQWDCRPKTLHNRDQSNRTFLVTGRTADALPMVNGPWLVLDSHNRGLRRRY